MSPENQKNPTKETNQVQQPNEQPIALQDWHNIDLNITGAMLNAMVEALDIATRQHGVNGKRFVDTAVSLQEKLNGQMEKIQNQKPPKE